MLFGMKPAFARWATWAVVSAGTAWAAIGFPEEDRHEPVRQLVEIETKLELPAHLRRATLPREIGVQLFAAHDRAAARRELPSPAVKAALPQFPFRFAGHVKQSGGALTL